MTLLGAKFDAPHHNTASQADKHDRKNDSEVPYLYQDNKTASGFRGKKVLTLRLFSKANKRSFVHLVDNPRASGSADHIYKEGSAFLQDAALEAIEFLWL